ncbi:hypothetical protein A8B75_14415 [Sphingomonadales bacterium EhC05]|nr:hypothetical protein A8B75_14415 [Sphingomonadales bacterium EhC05]
MRVDIKAENYIYCSMRRCHEIVDLIADGSDAGLDHLEFVKPEDFRCDYVFLDQLDASDENYDKAIVAQLRFITRLTISDRD